MIKKRTAAISEVCSIKMGYTFRKKPVNDPAGNLLAIQPKDVSSDGVINTMKLCRVDQPLKNLLNEGDVLLINRGRFTAAVFNGSLDAPCVATSAFMVLTPKDPLQLLPEYLALYFNSTEGQNIFKRLNETTTIPFVSRTNLESVEIPLPSLERQEAMAKFGELNQTYARLSTRKLNLQKRILEHELSN